VSRREIAWRSALGVAAALCLALAVGLALLAADVVRWQDALRADDVRYRVAPETTDLWQPSQRVPADGARRLLGVGDDVAFRQAVRALRLGKLETATVSDPSLALRRNEAIARLEAVVASEHDPKRRSRAAGLLGALGLARLAYETQDRVALLQSTVASLQFALALDPSNDEAKYNLELAFQRGRGIQLSEGAGGTNPTPGGSGAKGAGAGDPGSGY
jgi:hypothetical protein